jgi:AcrR family transcriptional regulator
MTTRRSKKKPGRKSARRRTDIGLPEALLAATEEILREHGLDGFTLREAARRAGVSHGAPAFHFGDVSGLLTAFAAGGYDDLTALMIRYRADAPKEASSQLVAVGCAYIDYAITHRPQFQLMFRSDRIRLEDSRYKEASKRSFQQLQETMMPFLSRDLTDSERMLKLMLAWAAVHGFATLYLERRFTQFYSGDRLAEVSLDAKHMLELLTKGFAVNGGANPPTGTNKT